VTQGVPRRAVGRATSLALAMALASQPGCGFAERTGRGAAEGAIGALAGKIPDREDLMHLTEGIKRRVARSALDELSKPQQLDDLQRIAAAVAAGTVSGASREASGAREAVDRTGERGQVGTKGATPVEAISAQAARAFSQQIVAELGPLGDGPLTTSLSAATEQVTGSMARGALGELAALFPECRGADASRCRDAAVERMSRASSAGVAAGVRDALGVWPLVSAFGGGALVALALAWAWAMYRARRPTPAS
jgi:hypothetical protein